MQWNVLSSTIPKCHSHFHFNAIQLALPPPHPRNEGGLGRFITSTVCTQVFLIIPALTPIKQPQMPCPLPWQRFPMRTQQMPGGLQNYTHMFPCRRRCMTCVGHHNPERSPLARKCLAGARSCRMRWGNVVCAGGGPARGQGLHGVGPMCSRLSPPDWGWMIHRSGV